MASVDRNPAICVAAAESGKHILFTKPAARTLDEAVKVRDAVHRAGVSFLPGESRARGAEHSRMLHDWVREGRFGRILTASFSMWTGLPRAWPTDEAPDGSLTPGVRRAARGSTTAYTTSTCCGGCSTARCGR